MPTSLHIRKTPTMSDFIIWILTISIPVCASILCLFFSRRTYAKMREQNRITPNKNHYLPTIYEQVMPLSLLPLSILIISIGWTRIQDFKHAPEWPKVSATIVTSHLGHTKYGYTPDVNFSYETQGVQRKGSFVFLDRPAMPKSQAMKYVNELTPGRGIFVHVKPSDQDRAVIIPKSDDKGWFLFFFGTFFALLSVGGTVFLHLTKSRHKADICESK
jgi:Protein of unknown function (DUF3592)